MKFWQQSLMARLILYFLLLSLSIGAIGVYIAYTQARDALEQSVVERLTAAATLKEEALVRWVADQQSVIASIAELPSVRQNASLLLNASNNSESITPSSIENMVYSVSFSSDGQRLVTTGIDRTLRVWNVQTGEQMYLIENETAHWPAVFSPNDQWLAAAGDDFSVRVWEAASGQLVTRIPHQDQISDFAFSPDSSLLASASKDGVVVIWSMQSLEPITQIEVMPGGGFVNSVAFSPDGSLLATASDDFLGRTWDVKTGAEIARTAHEGWVLIAKFSPDGKWVATGSEDGTARVWEADSGRAILTVTHDDWLTDVAFSPDGRILATAGDDRVVKLWNVAKGEEIARFEHENPLVAVRFSADGRWLMTLEKDSSRLSIWNVETKKLIRELMHDKQISDFAISPDSQQVATASADGSVRLWQIETGAELLRVAHQSQPRALLARSLAESVQSRPDLDMLSVVDRNGRQLLSTDVAHEEADAAVIAQEIGELSHASHGLQTASVEVLHVCPVAEKQTITIATPLYLDDGEIGGRLLAHLNLARMDSILAEDSGLGFTGETYLVNPAGERTMAGASHDHADDDTDGYAASYAVDVKSKGIGDVIAKEEGAGLYQNYGGVPVIGVYRWLDSLNVGLLAELQQHEATAPARRLAGAMLLIGLVLAAATTMGIYLLARQVTRPLLIVAEAAAGVGEETFEDAQLVQVVERQDEIGLLARTVYKMAQDVQARAQHLRQQVQELRIEIDEAKRVRQVTEITETDYFQELRTRAQQMRQENAEKA
ncbi:MAG: hypothetical protein H6641_13380 [Caldilineaceae bacterium]|nr:hypothetical protein [Caldilineaceae bacterium]